MILQSLRFGLVGVIGFIIDGGLLFLILSAYDVPYLARALTFPLAVTATWYLNRKWTFKSVALHAQRREKTYALYVGVQITGAAINYLVYVVVLSLIEYTPTNALGAFVVGSAAGMITNFAGARWLVFAAPCAIDGARDSQ